MAARTVFLPPIKETWVRLLATGPSPKTVGIWTVNHQMGHSHFVSLSRPFAFEIN